jgi:hypothetical protein
MSHVKQQLSTTNWPVLVENLSGAWPAQTLDKISFGSCGKGKLMGLYHLLDGITHPKYKLLHFLTTKIVLQTEECNSFKLR